MKIGGIDFEDAVWKPDCQGKWDFDFPLVRVSSRYWPDFTATSSIMFGDKEIIHTDDYIRGESEAEVKFKVEQWVNEHAKVVIEHVMSALSSEGKSNG